MTSNALQQDSEARIANYQRLKDEAQKRGDGKMFRQWIKAFTDERKNLEVIKRVEYLNALGILDQYHQKAGTT